MKAGGKPKGKPMREAQKQNSGIPCGALVFFCGASQRPLGSSLLSVVNRDVPAIGVNSGFQNDYRSAARNLAGKLKKNISKCDFSPPQFSGKWQLSQSFSFPSWIPSKVLWTAPSPETKYSFGSLLCFSFLFKACFSKTILLGHFSL